MRLIRSLLVLLAAAGPLAGCVSDYGSGAATSSSGIGTTGLAAGAAAGALVAAWVILPERSPRLDADSLTYKTSANLELCLGSSGRESELLGADRARWTYVRDECRFAVLLDQGRVTQTTFASRPEACRATLTRCLER